MKRPSFAGSPACGMGLRGVQHFLESVHNVVFHEAAKRVDALRSSVAIGEVGRNAHAAATKRTELGTADTAGIRSLVFQENTYLARRYTVSIF